MNREEARGTERGKEKKGEEEKRGKVESIQK